MKKLSLFWSYIFINALSAFNAYAGITETTAPDSTHNGPHPVSSAEYRFPATIDKDVMQSRKTEIWAKVFYPNDMMASSEKLPLIMMLHGNYATCISPTDHYTSCQYTNSGTCPAGYIPVMNHAGYDYLAENLASWGFVVSSINANRGITCGGGEHGDSGLNLARGRLVLKHLSLFYTWSTAGGAPTSLGLGQKGLIGKIDFSQVGLFGHSRGGEGMRAAYKQYLDEVSQWPSRIPGLNMKAIFEIGAVDGQTHRVLDANGTVWNQLLPMCDGDVDDLQGRFPFERMLLNASEVATAQKSLYEVWGANHNFFNTEWKSSDSSGCSFGKAIFDPNGSYSEKQQTIALASVPAFFRSRLGVNADASFNQNFNPLNTLPQVVTRITQVDRDFTPSPGSSETAIVDDFDRATGINSSGNYNAAQQITIQHISLESYQRAAKISWNKHDINTFFEAIWAGAAQGRDIHDFATLDFRVGRTAYSTSPTNFKIMLEDANGLFSKEVFVKDYANINGPGNDNPILMTVRIPLTAFQGVALTNIHGVRFVFDQSHTGSIYLANIRVHRQIGLGGTHAGQANKHIQSHMTHPKPKAIVYVPTELNSIRSVRYIGKSFALSGAPGVEISLASQVPFTVMNRLPVLKIGNATFTLSRYSDDKALKELTFTLTHEEYKNIHKEGDVTILNGKVWKFGSIAKYVK